MQAGCGQCNRVTEGKILSGAKWGGLFLEQLKRFVAGNSTADNCELTEFRLHQHSL